MENKAKITNKEIERALDNMAFLEQRQEEFCLRLRTVQEELGEDVREKAVESLSNFFERKICNWKWIKCTELILFRNKKVPSYKLVYYIGKNIRIMLCGKDLGR